MNESSKEDELKLYAKMYRSLGIDERAIITLNNSLELLQDERDHINNELSMLKDAHDAINAHNDVLTKYDVRDLSFYQIIKIKLGC